MKKFCKSWFLFLYLYNVFLTETVNSFAYVAPAVKPVIGELRSTQSANNAPRTRRNYYDGLEFGYEVPGSGRMRGSEQGFGSEFRYPTRYGSRWKNFNYYDDDWGRDDDYFSFRPRSYYGMNDVYEYDRGYYNGWNRSGRQWNDYSNRYPRYPRYPSQDRYYGSSYYGNPWDDRYGRRAKKYYDYDDSYYERQRPNLYDDYHNDFYYNYDDYYHPRFSSSYHRRHYDDWNYDYDEDDDH